MLTKKQAQILSELRLDSRQHISSLAEKLGMKASTCHSSYRRIAGMIKKSTVILDFAMLGYSLRVNFVFRLKDAKMPGQIAESVHINSLQRINDRSTFLAGCIFRSTGEAYLFKEMLQSSDAKSIEMHYIIEELKKERFAGFSEPSPSAQSRLS